jgi:alpha-D-ribose 1-methylphosphonate 5-triphosphate synthase subunit PhnG
MFQTFDKATDQILARKTWLALLARAPLVLLNNATKAHLASVIWLRKPETGLMMVQGRVGGTGDRFNFGETTVTRCTLRLKNDDDETPLVGISYILGRSHEQATLAAVADALLQQPDQYEALTLSLLTPIKAHLISEQQRRHQQAQSTKVDFFTVARQADIEQPGKQK